MCDPIDGDNLLVRFASFPSNQAEDEMLEDWACKLAAFENKTYREIEAEFGLKLEYRKGRDRAYPMETWGPPELAERISRAIEGVKSAARSGA